jgi:hypothetical protein
MDDEETDDELSCELYGSTEFCDYRIWYDGKDKKLIRARIEFKEEEK